MSKLGYVRTLGLGVVGTIIVTPFVVVGTVLGAALSIAAAPFIAIGRLFRR